MTNFNDPFLNKWSMPVADRWDNFTLVAETADLAGGAWEMGSGAVKFAGKKIKAWTPFKKSYELPVIGDEDIIKLVNNVDNISDNMLIETQHALNTVGSMPNESVYMNQMPEAVDAFRNKGAFGKTTSIMDNMNLNQDTKYIMDASLKPDWQLGKYPLNEVDKAYGTYGIYNSANMDDFNKLDIGNNLKDYHVSSNLDGIPSRVEDIKIGEDTAENIIDSLKNGENIVKQEFVYPQYNRMPYIPQNSEEWKEFIDIRWNRQTNGEEWFEYLKNKYGENINWESGFTIQEKNMLQNYAIEYVQQMKDLGATKAQSIRAQIKLT